MFRIRALSSFGPVLLAILLTALLGCGRAIAQDEQQGIDNIAADVAQAITRNAHGSPAPVEVFVEDFGEANQPTTLLGVSLANEFAFALSTHAGGFDVIDRARLTGMAQHDLTGQDAWKCYCKPHGTPVFVTGTFTELGDTLGLALHVQEFHAPLVDRGIQISLTPNLKALASAPAPARPTPTWVSRDHPPDPDVKPARSGTLGVGYPACIDCPQAQYSAEGTGAKIEGTVTLDVVITAEGFPAKITLLRGLPCGMSEAAMKAVEHWKFRPATMDGKPVETSQVVEVTFHLY
ncbi:MAG TPA: energy transducer TonB [Candidatus Acidoferrales bacterium]|nr:energy transducer TonB [Candidatus Acidoferrales bacterium]